MPPTRLFVDQGRVTSRDASLLKPGECSVTNDAYYKPGNPALWCVPGRTLYNATPEAGTIFGIRFLGFDSATDVIVVRVGTTYRWGPATATGSFTTLATGLPAGGSFDSIFYNNQHILTTGLARALVVDSTLTTRNLGMLENTVAPTLNTSTGAGPGFKVTSGSFITYWIEERVKSGSLILRRNAVQPATQPGTAPAAVVALISSNSATVYKPRISKPATVNSDATHWAVFATATTALDPTNLAATGTLGFPVGAEIGEATIGTAFIDDTRVAVKDPGFPPGPIYETMAVNLNGAFLQVPRNGPPPIFSTGDILEESPVVNDVSDPSIVRYSWPEEIDKWPALNFIKFAEKEHDEVRIIKTVGNVIVTLLRDTAWRIDYLPRPEDAEFNRGRCRSRIPGAPGVVSGTGNVQTVGLFSMGDKYFLAYVSPIGLVMTDGFTQNVLTDDMDWPNTVNLSTLNVATITINEAKYQIEFRYPSPGSSVADKLALINIHPSHLKPGNSGGFRGKATWPVARPSTCATAAQIGGFPGVYSAQGTSLYVEWAGTTDPATGVPIAFEVQTGDIYPGGLGTQSNIERVWIHHNAGAVASAITGLITSKNERQADTLQTWSLPAAAREANNETVSVLAEAVVLGARIDAPTAEACINYFSMTGEEADEAKN